MAPLDRENVDSSDDASDASIEDPGSGSSPVYSNKRRRTETVYGEDEDEDDVDEDDDSETDPGDSGDEGSGLDSEEQQEEDQIRIQELTNAAKDRGINAPLEEGILESVHVVNFMNHSNYLFEIGPLINFICGKNGSGKSAIMTAITMCLGGKAADTNRSRNLAGLIKHGKDSARVSVKIKNRGDNAYMPEVYGESITVERSFTRNSSMATSAYKLKAANGRTVSILRRDLDDMSDYFNLQISNPMTVLTQDAARQFIGTSSPKDKYKFFVKGIQLEQLDQDYRVIESSIDEVEVKLGQTNDDVHNLKGKMNTAKRTLEASDKHQETRRRLDHVRKQLAWCQVIAMEKHRDEFLAKIQENEQSIDAEQARADELDRSFQSADRDADEARVQYEQANDQVRQREEEKAEGVDRQKEIKHDVSLAQASERQLRDSLRSTNITLKGKQRDIDAEKERLEQLDNGGTAARHAQLDQAEQDANAAKQSYSDHIARRPEVLAKVEEATQECQERREPLGRKKEEIADRQRRIQNLSRDRNQDSAFHRSTPALLKAIDNERTFSQKPIGPLGKFVKLTKPEWSSIVEKTFGGTLNSFVVTSKNDRTILNRIMHRVQCVVPILIGNNHPLDTAPNEPDQQFDTVLRILAFDNDLVRKQLVIHHGIEQTILIPDVEEGSRVLYAGARPRNVKRCLTFQSASDKGRGIVLSFTRNGGASQDPIDEWRGPARVQTDIAAQTRLQEEALQSAKQQFNRLETAHQAALSTLERAKQAKTRHERDERQLQLDSQKADTEWEALRDAINEDSGGNAKLMALQQNLREAEEARVVDEEQYKDAIAAGEHKKLELSAAKKELTRIDSEIEKIQAEADKKQAEARKVDKKRAGCLTEKNAVLARVEDGRRDQQSYRLHLEEHQASLNHNTQQALQVSPRVEVDEGDTHAGLTAKYDAGNREIERAEARIGSREDIARKAVETERAYQIGKKQQEELEALTQSFKLTLLDRRKRWEQFRDSITARARIQFAFYLSGRGFRGELRADHRNQNLTITVEPDFTKRKSSARQTTTLSGGEKSFSQICLLLSIWEAMGSPIRCLDEFDVYMDSVNRKLSIDLLIEAARTSQGRQFIFITPGSRSDIKLAPDVFANELEQPDRGQATIDLNGQPGRMGYVAS